MEWFSSIHFEKPDPSLNKPYSLPVRLRWLAGCSALLNFRGHHVKVEASRQGFLITRHLKEKGTTTGANAFRVLLCCTVVLPIFALLGTLAFRLANHCIDENHPVLTYKAVDSKKFERLERDFNEQIIERGMRLDKREIQLDYREIQQTKKAKLFHKRAKQLFANSKQIKALEAKIQQLQHLKNGSMASEASAMSVPQVSPQVVLPVTKPKDNAAAQEFWLMERGQLKLVNANLVAANKADQAQIEELNLRLERVEKLNREMLVGLVALHDSTTKEEQAPVQALLTHHDEFKAKLEKEAEQKKAQNLQAARELQSFQNFESSVVFVSGNREEPALIQ